MSLKSNFKLMADYNQWANENVYLAASKLDVDELSKDRGAFFGSIIGTLNHILVADIIWLKRFSEHPSKLKALDLVRDISKPKALNDILYPEFKCLESMRIKLDEIIQGFIHELTEETLASNLFYNNAKGEPFIKNFGQLIQHFFNHQTHHRGQVSILLSQAGMDVGVTDLLARIRSE